MEKDAPHRFRDWYQE